MTDAQAAPVRVAPIFVIADDDRAAIELIQRMLNVEWYYIALWETGLVVRYARHFATTAIFLADPIAYPNGGTARLLQELLDQVGKPVVILCELWSPEIAAKWKRMGATDCIPHPTRCEARMEGLRFRMQEFAISGLAHLKVPDSEIPGRPHAATTYFQDR